MSSNNRNRNRNRNRKRNRKRNRTAKKGKKFKLNKTFKSPQFKKHQRGRNENNIILEEKIQQLTEDALKAKKEGDKQKAINLMRKLKLSKNQLEKQLKSEKFIDKLGSIRGKYTNNSNQTNEPSKQPLDLSKTLVNKPMDKCNIYEWNEINDCNTHTYIHNNEEHVCRNPIIKRKGAKCSEKSGVWKSRKTKSDYDKLSKEDIPVVVGMPVSDPDISQNYKVVKGTVIETDQDIKPNTFIKSEISYKKKDNKIFTNIRLFFKKNSIDVSPYSNRNINDLVYFLKLDANKNDDIPPNTILDDGNYYSVDIKTMIPGNDIQKAKKDVQKEINSFVKENLQ